MILTLMAKTANEPTYGQTLNGLLVSMNLNASVTRIVMATIKAEVVAKDGIGECVDLSFSVPVSGVLMLHTQKTILEQQPKQRRGSRVLKE